MGAEIMAQFCVAQAIAVGSETSLFAIVDLIYNQLVASLCGVALGVEAGAGGEGHLFLIKCPGRGSVCRAPLQAFSSRRLASVVGAWLLSSCSTHRKP